MSQEKTEALAQRAEMALSDLQRIPAPGPEVFGAQDSQTAERWNAGNILGHLAEALPLWTRQARDVIRGGAETGRGTSGYVSRREGIDRGGGTSEAQLKPSIAAAVSELVAFLRSLSDADLDRRILHHARTEDRQLTLGDFIDEFLVGHLEEHVLQIKALTPDSGSG